MFDLRSRTTFGVQKPMSDLEKKIEQAINSVSAENDSNTPDFILAQYLISCLAAFNTAIQQRETWYGRDARPGALQVVVQTGEGPPRPPRQAS